MSGVIFTVSLTEVIKLVALGVLVGCFLIAVCLPRKKRHCERCNSTGTCYECAHRSAER